MGESAKQHRNGNGDVIHIHDYDDSNQCKCGQRLVFDDAGMSVIGVIPSTVLEQKSKAIH